MSGVVLAHQPAFDLGPLRVCPETRSVIRDGVEEVIEPRVMQVLVILAEADGHVVARDDLVQRCWDGRIVGDDAINRVISRLRRLAEGLGRDIFVIETVTKVGYRLRRLDAADPPGPARAESESLPSRRGLMTGVVLGGAALLAGGGWWWSREPAPSRDPRSEALFRQALVALGQQTREGQSQAAGILRQLVADDPEDSGAWGALALVYVHMGHLRTQAEASILYQRAREAAARSLALDPNDGRALVSLATARPDLGNWLDTQRQFERRLEQGGDVVAVMRGLTSVFAQVGRNRSALRLFRRLLPETDPSPSREYGFSRILWMAGRLEETDTVLARASELYPTHFAIWFTRFYTFLYSGRQAAALAMATDTARRPSDIASSEIDIVTRVARASLAPVAAEIDALVEVLLERSERGAGHAENGVQFALLLGRPQIAIAILRAYYFGEGFVVPENRYGVSPGTATPRNDRLTNFLFGPSMVPLHGTAEFRALTARLGLDAYWQASNTRLSARGVPID